MLLRLLAAALVALAPLGPALADEVQFHVCTAGQNLGEAYARTQYFNGLLGPDQSAQVALDLANAAANIEVAEAGVQPPFSTSPERQRSVSELQGKLTAFARNAEGRSPEARMSMIQGFYTQYLNALAITYVSSRPDAFQWTSTCDSAMLEANWHLGRAGTYAAVRFDRGRVEETQARAAQGGANGSAHQAIRKGLSLAVDGISPPPLVACFFNTERAWSVVPMLRPDEPHQSYVELLPRVLEVCRSAGPHGALGAHVTVPAVVGLALAEAKRLLAEAGLKVRLAPGSPAGSPGASGTVEEQSPISGSRVARDAEVRLVVHSPYVPSSVPSGVPPPESTAVADRGGIPVCDPTGSYQQGQVRVTYEGGRYVGRNFGPRYDEPDKKQAGFRVGFVEFDVGMESEEFVVKGIRRLGRRGRCVDAWANRPFAYEECLVSVAHTALMKRPLDLSIWVLRGGRPVGAAHYWHDDVFHPRGCSGVTP